MTFGRFLSRAGLKQPAAFGFFLRQWSIPGDAKTTAAIFATMRPCRAVLPILVERPPAQRITIVAPHPDDELMGVGGTLLRALSQKVSVCVIYLTDGDNDSGAAASRREEASAISATLGYDAVFLGLSVGPAILAGDAHRQLAKAIDASKPDILFYPFVLDDNDDHRLANGLLAACSKSGALSWRGDVWSYQVYSAVPGNVLVPLGEFAAKKADAIRLYKSQSAVRDWATFALGLNAVNARFTPRACRDPYVESFLVVSLDSYLEAVEQWVSYAAADHP
jgi:LmbE family N-acetylglucosaminyl deacetylase